MRRDARSEKTLVSQHLLKKRAKAATAGNTAWLANFSLVEMALSYEIPVPVPTAQRNCGTEHSVAFEDLVSCFR